MVQVSDTGSFEPFVVIVKIEAEEKIFECVPP
jgi:hypothetical protein